jgi:hypothetical protein
LNFLPSHSNSIVMGTRFRDLDTGSAFISLLISSISSYIDFWLS